MVLCKNKFWYNNITDLFYDWRLIPTRKMSLDLQIDCLIRFLIIIFILCLVFVSQNTIFFLIFIIIIIIILYIIKGNTMIQEKEHFEYTYPDTNASYPSKNSNIRESRYKRAPVNKNGDIIQDTNLNPFAYDSKELTANDNNYVSNNYKIVGNANPKTLIPPVVIAPIADLSYWRANNLITHSAVNDNKNIDVYQSGYEVSNFCGDNQCPPTNNNFDYIKLNSNYKKVKDGESHKFDLNRNHKYHQKYNDHQKQTHNPHYNMKYNDNQKQTYNPHYDMKYNDIQENFSYTNVHTPQNIDLVNKSCGYDPTQYDNYRLPSNTTVGKCEKQKNMKDFNQNLYAQLKHPRFFILIFI